MEHVVSLAAGGLFGLALDKAKTNVPSVVSDQMEMRNMTMLRMFVSASAASTAAMVVLDALGVRKRDVRTSMALGFGKLGGYGGNVLGGLLLGAGMYLTGSCPGTAWAQLPLGEAAATLPSLIAGGLVGTILYGYAEKHIRACTPNYQKRGTVKESDLVPSHLNYALMSAAYVGVAALVLYAVDQQYPWQSQVAKTMPGYPLASPAPQLPLQLDAVAWDPAVAGIIVGLLQFPMHLTTAGALGMSSAWVLVASNIAALFDRDLANNAPYLDKNRSNSHALTQLLTGVGVALGVVASQTLSGWPALTAEASARSNIAGMGAAGHATSFLGGALLLVGARVQAGCTSGHGLTGLSSLSLASLISVGCMFAGGMSLGLLHRALM